MNYIERVFGCQYYFDKKSNKFSEYMFAFCLALCYD